MHQRIGRSLVVLALVVAAILVVVLARQNSTLQDELRSAQRREALPYEGFVVPAFSTTTLSGDMVTIAQGEPGSRQVLFFFNTVCGFCVEALPSWKELYARLRVLQPQVTVYGVSLDPEPETRAYVEDHELPFPVVHFPDSRLAKVYRTEVIPHTVVLDHEGTVVHARLSKLKNQAAIDSVVSLVRQPAPLAKSAGE